MIEYIGNLRLYAAVAELADALDLGSSVNDVGVQVPLAAPKQRIRSHDRIFLFKYHLRDLNGWK